MKWSAAITVCASILNLALQAHAANLNAQIDDYRTRHEPAIVAQLDELTRLKSVAADPAGLKATADRLQQLLKQRGFDARQLCAGTSMPPVLFGVLKSARAQRTVIFYAHYDGQPVTPSPWSSDPFVPVMRSGALS